MNAEHLRNLPDIELLEMFRQELGRSGYPDFSKDTKRLNLIIEAMKERVSFVSEFITSCRYFYEAPTEYEQKSIDKNWHPETSSHLNSLMSEFLELDNPGKSEFEKTFTMVCSRLDIPKGKLIHPLRLAVSGQSTGPGIFDILEILGKDEVIKRIDSAIKNIKN